MTTDFYRFPVQAGLLLAFILTGLASAMGCRTFELSPTPTLMQSQTSPTMVITLPTVTQARLLTQTPTLTPSPTNTLIPTPTLYALESTPIPETLPRITSQNAVNVSALASWQFEPVSDMEWTADGYILAVAGESTIALYETLSRRVLRSLYPQTSGIVDMAFSPDGKWLVVGSRQLAEENRYISKLELWQGPDWKPRGIMYDVPLGLSALSFSPDGAILAVAYPGLLPSPSTIDFWISSRWQISNTLQTESAIHITFSPDGRFFAASPHRYALKVWDLKEGELLWDLPTSFTGAVSALAFSPFGNYLASGHYDGVVRLWNMDNGELVVSFQAQGVVESLAFSPDGSLIASGSSFSSSAVRIWGIATGQLLRELEGHQGGVTRLLFSPNGNYLVSASYDGMLRLWGIWP